MANRKVLAQILSAFASLFFLASCLEEDNNQIQQIEDAAFLRIFNAYENKEKFLSNSYQRDGVGLLINKSVGEGKDTLQQTDAIIFEGIEDRVFYKLNSEYGSFMWDKTTSYPTISDLVPVAPVINSIDYYKWASVKAGSETRVTFLKRVKKFGFGSEYVYLSNPLVDTTLSMKENKFYSSFLIKNPSDTSKFKLHVVEDDFASRQFAEDKMYFRFLNLNTDLPDELDVFYFATYGTGDCSSEGVTNGKCQRDTLFTPTLLGTFNNKFPINGDELPFFSLEIPEGYIVKNGKPVEVAAIPVISLWIYRKGESHSNGNVPLVSIGLDPFGGSVSYPFLIPPANNKFPYKRNSISNIVLSANIPEPETATIFGFAVFDLERSNALDEYFKR